MNSKIWSIVALPALAFVLHDFVFQLPDNQHEPTLGFFATVLALFAVWGTCGFLVPRGVSLRPLRGAAYAVASVLLLAATFGLLNRFFADRMSYEPDRIRAFRASGARSMQEYVTHFDPGPAPLLMVCAAVAGAVGGALPARRRQGSLG